MVCLRLLTKMVLGMILMAYTSVRCLETGYEYTGYEHVERDVLHKDLRCGYLFNGYTQLRFIKLLFGEPYNIKFNVAIGIVSNLSDLVKSQVATLIGLKGIRIGAMWALHLFTILISSFYQDTKIKTRQNYQNVFDSLVFVIEKLNEDLDGCRKGNSFDSYDSMVESGEKLALVDIKRRLLKQHTDKAWGLLHRNHKSRDCVFDNDLETNLKLKWLFFGNLGMVRELREDLQNVYNLRMKWNLTGGFMFSSWQNARVLDWKQTQLQNVKKYYNECFDHLKIIMFRLTTKHMAYLRPYVDDAEAFKYYAQQWYNIVVQFSTLLHLSGDLLVKNLLHVLENLINGIEKIDGVVRYIAVKLAALCKPFGCYAIDPFVIDNQEFTVSYSSLTLVEMQLLTITFSPVWIEYYSLENAKRFLSHLKMAFDNVNFGAIQSLVEYIDELNATNWVERLDSCAEELERLLINVSDFE